MLGLIERLDRETFDPIVLFNGPKGSATPLFRERGVDVQHDSQLTTYQHAQGAWIGLRGLHPWQAITKALDIYPSAKHFVRFLLANRIDLVHLNTSVQIPAAIAARRLGIPVVWHIREEIHPGYFGFRRSFVRKCFERYSNQIVVISKQNASKLLPSQKITVIYNSVDFSRFNKNVSGSIVREALNLDESVPIILMLGGVVQHKGADVLIEAARIVRKKYPAAKFLIAGMSPKCVESPSPIRRGARRLFQAIGFAENASKRCLQLIDRYALADTVKFLGFRKDIPELIACSTMLVWPATVSHFARPIMEAGAMAKPVVASDFESSREIVEEGSSGLLFRPRDAKAFSSAIITLLDNPDMGRRLGMRGYELAVERFEADNNVAATFKIYEKALGVESVGINQCQMHLRPQKSPSC